MDLSDLAANVLQHQRTTPDLIADALREAILRGTLKEGQALKQDEIAQQFGVSRIPVREALRQLEAEGLATLYPNRGAAVSVLSPSEVREIFEIRLALETAALQFAMLQLTDADLQKAEAILEATERETDVGRLAQLNWEFHAVLYAPASRPRLLTMIKTLHVNIERYVRLQMEKMKYLDRSQKEHYQLLDALRRQDSKGALRLLKRHIEGAGEQLIVYLKEPQNN